MPKTTTSGKPKPSELPGTLKRSPAKAQRTFAKAHDSAAEEYGEGERAHRTAYAALKHSFEKVGDHWEPKSKPGPSDPQGRQRGAQARSQPRPTAGGVDVEGHTKDELMQRARKLDIRGRSRMTKLELGRAIARSQD
jgi:cation transport regulator ChaB